METDTFGFKICAKPYPSIRSGIPSAASSVFDPLDFSAPFTLTAKHILQDLYRIKLDWDDEISPEYRPRWKNWLVDLPKLTSFGVNRCLTPADFGQVTFNQLLHFYDASEVAYRSVSFLRSVNEGGKIHCAFLFDKSRVTPMKAVSVPRLELRAAAMSVRHDKMFKRKIEISLNT